MIFPAAQRQKPLMCYFGFARSRFGSAPRDLMVSLRRVNNAKAPGRSSCSPVRRHENPSGTPTRTENFRDVVNYAAAILRRRIPHRALSPGARHSLGLSRTDLVRRLRFAKLHTGHTTLTALMYDRERAADYRRETRRRA